MLEIVPVTRASIVQRSELRWSPAPSVTQLPSASILMLCSYRGRVSIWQYCSPEVTFQSGVSGGAQGQGRMRENGDGAV